MRTKYLVTLAVVLILAVALVVVPASAGKRKRAAVPATPAIPTGVLPDSLQIPPGAESLLGQWLSPAESLAVVAAFLELTPEQVSSLTTLLQSGTRPSRRSSRRSSRGSSRSPNSSSRARPTRSPSGRS